MVKQKRTRLSDLDIVNESELTDAERAKFAPNPDATEIVCIIDRSGSMDSIKADAIGGFNSFLKEQQSQPGEATMTIALFDNVYELLCSGTPINEVQPLDNNTYVPRGSTALLDAMGNTLTELNKRNPKKAIIMILTDGQENASTKFKKQQIKEMVDTCEKKEWFVTYISASMDAINDARSVGVGMGQTISFNPDSRGANVVYGATSMAASQYRSGGMGAMMSMASYSSAAASKYDASQQHQNPWGDNRLKVDQITPFTPSTTSGMGKQGSITSTTMSVGQTSFYTSSNGPTTRRKGRRIP